MTQIQLSQYMNTLISGMILLNNTRMVLVIGFNKMCGVASYAEKH